MEYPYKNKELEDLPGEEWKDIEGFSDLYQVSSHGRVKSLNRYVNHKSGKHILIKGKILSQTIYRHLNKFAGDEMFALRVALSQENKRYDYQVRRLVYQAFIGDLDGEQYVINANGDGFNNMADNLKLVTKSEKQKIIINRNRIIPSLMYLDRSKFPKTYGGYSRQKPIGQYTLDWVLIRNYPSIAEACRKTGCDEKSIINVAKGRWKHHHGFMWKYE